MCEAHVHVYTQSLGGGLEACSHRKFRNLHPLRWNLRAFSVVNLSSKQTYIRVEWTCPKFCLPILATGFSNHKKISTSSIALSEIELHSLLANLPLPPDASSS